MSYEILRGDCLAVLKTLSDSSVDSIVTDPPYELGFMGKAWDASGIANNVEMWREALRVLKPGGHLLAFSGSRTYHRMTCAIEDAGFEVRDQIMWVYSTGFPKSHNMDNHAGKLTCGCTTDSVPYIHENTEQKTQCDLSDLLGPDVSAPVGTGEGRGQVLQPSLPEQSASAAGRPQLPHTKDGRGQSSLEGRGDDVQAEGKLQGHPLHSGTGSTAADGAGRRLHNGTSGGDGAVVQVSADAIGSGPPRRPRSDKQSSQQSGTVADKQCAQTPRAWPDCARCGLPVVPSGLGTALKPAHEPICVARKPLVGTVAANVLAHGTGALNIDGCRVGSESRPVMGRTETLVAASSMAGASTGATATGEITTQGRWPANIIHDGSDEVVALFPQSKGQQAAVGPQHGAKASVNVFGDYGPREQFEPRGDTGSAARFFYCAKASKKDRNEGCEKLPLKIPTHGSGNEAGGLSVSNSIHPNNNNHPTVKPTDLMAYLCRLVTPPGGLVLDPFTGSGSTGKAALREGFRFLGIELFDEYADIAEARLAAEYIGDLI